MDWLNYHHLLYFWMAAREGSMVRAAELLHLSQPTLSNQIAKLEKSLGSKLFQRQGRTLVLTEQGHTAFRYADEIFALGREFSDTLRGRATRDGLSVTIGIPDVLPKLVVYQLLRPALELAEPVRLVSYEGKLDQLLADLALHRLDVIISESPLGPSSHVRAFNHLLGECGVTFLAVGAVAKRYRAKFPQSLDQAPLLLPTQNTMLRRALELWFDELQVRPLVKHYFEDSSLLKVFGQAGEGIFCVPSAIADEVGRQYRVAEVGRTEAVKERFYAISVERRLKHPAVVAITESARTGLFRAPDA